MPSQVNKYLNRFKQTPIELSEETMRMMKMEQWERDIPDDLEWDIEEVINASDYIDDLDAWDETFGKQSWKNNGYNK